METDVVEVERAGGESGEASTVVSCAAESGSSGWGWEDAAATAVDTKRTARTTSIIARKPAVQTQ
jgi:hypothetical protein